MKKYLLILSIFLNTGFAFAQEEATFSEVADSEEATEVEPAPAITPPVSKDRDMGLFASVQYRKTSWDQLSSSTDGFDYQDDSYKTVDFTFKASKNFAVSALIDLSNEEKDATRLALNIGFEDWGAIIEKGQVYGDFKTDSDLDIQNRGRFDYEYTEYVIYKGQESKMGIGYINYIMPTKSEVEYGINDKVEFVDPEVEYKTFGYYMGYDNLRKYMNYKTNQSAKLFLSTSVILGLTSVTPSETHKSSIKSDIGRNPIYDSELHLGTMSEFTPGILWTRRYGSMGFGLSVGYQVRIHGTIMPLGDNDEKYAVNPGTAMNILHGPFIRLAGLW